MMYRIEFNGRLMPGFDPQIVRLTVAERLRLTAPQVDRLFSGKTVVLKKLIGGDSCGPYLDELRSFGMEPVLVPLSEETPSGEAPVTFKVVFWGTIRKDFDRTQVMQAAAKRLRLPPALLLKVFSGVKVVLKRGVTAAEGARYVSDLAQIGMHIELEADAPPVQEKVVAVAQAPAVQEDDQFAALLKTDCDFTGTALSSYGLNDETPPETPAPPPPPPVMPVRKPVQAKTNKEGFENASTEGYVNCPRCGHYQPQAVKCRVCGIDLPRPRVYVGRMDASSRSAPTSVVPDRNAKPDKAAESLRDLMHDQAFPEEDRVADFPLLKVIWITGIVAVAVIVWWLSR